MVWRSTQGRGELSRAAMAWGRRFSQRGLSGKSNTPYIRKETVFSK
jgi:hypothetical protein